MSITVLQKRQQELSSWVVKATKLVKSESRISNAWLPAFKPSTPSNSFNHQQSSLSICEEPLIYTSTFRTEETWCLPGSCPEAATEGRTYQSLCDQRPALGCLRAARQCWSRQWACLRGNPQQNGGLHPLQSRKTQEKTERKDTYWVPSMCNTLLYFPRYCLFDPVNDPECPNEKDVWEVKSLTKVM